MAVKIRLAQRGKKKTRTYRVVVADARSNKTEAVYCQFCPLSRSGEEAKTFIGHC